MSDVDSRQGELPSSYVSSHPQTFFIPAPEDIQFNLKYPLPLAGEDFESEDEMIV